MFRTICSTFLLICLTQSYFAEATSPVCVDDPNRTWQTPSGVLRCPEKAAAGDCPGEFLVRFYCCASCARAARAARARRPPHSQPSSSGSSSSSSSSSSSVYSSRSVTPQCVDDPNRYWETPTGTVRCAEKAASGDCFDPHVRRYCCRSCRDRESRCEDIANAQFAFTDGFVTDCEGVVGSGWCNQPGVQSKCCHSCRHLQRSCLDDLSFVWTVNGARQRCADRGRSGGCVNPEVRQKCCKSCRNWRCADTAGASFSLTNGHTFGCQGAVGASWCYRPDVRESCCLSCTTLQGTCLDDPRRYWSDPITTVNRHCAEKAAAGACSNPAVKQFCCQSCQSHEGRCEDDMTKAWRMQERGYVRCPDMPGFNGCTNPSVQASCCLSCRGAHQPQRTR